MHEALGLILSTQERKGEEGRKRDRETERPKERAKTSQNKKFKWTIHL